MIRIKCPKCQKVLGLDDSNAGSPAQCPACKQKFMVPGKAVAGAAKKKPDDKAAAPGEAWKKPGTEDDDFTPYTLAPVLQKPVLMDKTIDDMVRFAKRQKERDRAWNQVGMPCKILKIWTMVVVGLSIISFLYITVIVILFLHKQKQGFDSEPLFPFNGIKAANFPALLVWGLNFGGFLLTSVICGIVLTGMEKMKKLESWGWAMTGCIVGMIFLGFFGVCFGGWGLSVLLNKDVKAEYYKKPGMAGLEEEEEEDEDPDEDEEEDEDEEDDEED